MSTQTPLVTDRERIASLEQSVTRLRKKVRRLERQTELPVDLTPELIELIDRGEEEVRQNPEAGETWHRVKAVALSRCQCEHSSNPKSWRMKV